MEGNILILSHISILFLDKSGCWQAKRHPEKDNQYGEGSVNYHVQRTDRGYLVGRRIAVL